jgi:hypothetical protein
MENKVLLNALGAAIEHEENIALRMLLVYSKEAIERMSKVLEETADMLDERTNFHAHASILRDNARGE